MAGNDLQTLTTERRGPVLHIVLNRPEVHDAFDERMIAELTDVFGDAADDGEVRVVVLRSTGKHFSAGADLEWMKRVGEYDRDDNLDDAGRLEDMLRAIACCPKPVVARVQGAALGGGAGLACAADFAVASEGAFFGFSEVRLGIAPAVISPYVLRKVPAGRAQALFLAGSRFDARRAQQLGLVWNVVPADELDEAVDELVGELLAGSPAAQAAIKSMVEAVEGRGFEAARDVTVTTIADLRASDEGKEGLEAFLDKRTPSWVPEESERAPSDGTED